MINVELQSLQVQLDVHRAVAAACAVVAERPRHEPEDLAST